MSRAPLRLRLTLAFASVMGLVLGATGFFLHARLSTELDQGINRSLRSAADDVAALVRQSDSGLEEAGGLKLAKRGESFAQVIDSRGRVLDASPLVKDDRLLSSGELARARGATTFVGNRRLPALGEPVRLLARPVHAQDQRLVVVVGASLEGRNAALDRLGVLLLIGGPIALLLASGAGYALATGALRPVEAMRSKAAALSGAHPSERLPVPRGNDEIVRLGTTLNDMLDRLERALDRERSFVANASHELLTPLAVLYTELELARERPAEELHTVLQSATDETGRLTRLARDLLLLARSDRGHLPIRRTRLSVSRLLSGVAARFRAQATASDREITTKAPNGLVLYADELRLEQALGNLVDNALRHGAGAVNLTADQDTDVVELRVRDHGLGFRPDFIEHAFERFSRPDDAESDGAGLGLAIVAMIANAHGGQAHAANRQPTGADIWLTLPE